MLADERAHQDRQLIMLAQQAVQDMNGDRPMTIN